MPYTATPSRLTVLLLTDIVGSTDLKTRLGLAEYAKRLARHDEIFKQLIGDTPNAEILKDTGDGYFASFATTSDAVRFALRFQQALRKEPWAAEPLRVRVGIHVGEVAQMELEDTGKPKIVGLAADLVSRLTRLAVGGQILLTRFAFNEARQFVSAHPGAGEISEAKEQLELKWTAHGPYLFRGADEPIEIFEVGAANAAPMLAPTGAGDARRAVEAGEDETLGWRPAIGLEVPQRPLWELEKRLGEGGFGEVWLARHRKIGTHRAFKFCFDSDRLRSFKRELTLFRLLHDNLGERPDIARIYEVKLDEPPYFLESQYTAGGNLKDWSDMEGGIDKIPMQTRLDIVARVADAVAAAHSVGVLHKDIKPSNILIAIEHGQPRPQLADFGIGIITDRSKLHKHSTTATTSVLGFTPGPSGEASPTGTRIYMPPEVLVGAPFTVQGDIYALGVLLYQLVIADLNRPLAAGWERDVADELLRQDIAACVDGDPAHRLTSAADLSRRLRTLEARRDSARRASERERLEERRQRLNKVFLGGAAGLIILLGLAGAAAWREFSLRREAERQREIAEATGEFLSNMLMSVSPESRQGQDVRVMDTLHAAEKQLAEPKTPWRPEVEAKVRRALGSAYRVLGEARLGEPHNRRAVELAEQIFGPDHPDTHKTRAEWAKTLGDAGDWDRAATMLSDAVGALERLEGPDSRAALAYKENLIHNLLAQGKLDEAQPLAEHVVDARRRLFGSDDVKTIDATATYAAVLFERGEYSRALEQFRAAHDARLKLSGPDHPATITCAQNIATLLYRTGDTKAGAELMQKVIESQKAAIGPEHPRTLDAMINLGLMKYTLGDGEGGVELLRQVLDVRQRKLGAEHPDTLLAQVNLGNMLATSINRYAEAEPILRDMLTTASRVLPPGHSQMQIARIALAKALGKMGKVAEADELYREVIATTERSRGADHPVTASHHTAYADFLITQSRWEEAEQHMLVALRVATSPRALSAAHEVNALRRLVRIADGKGDREAVAMYQGRLAQLTPSSAPAAGPSSAPAPSTGPAPDMITVRQ